MSLKIFDKWEIESVNVNDSGLKNYINLKAVVIPKTFGRLA